MSVRLSVRVGPSASEVLTSADLTPLGGFKLGPTDGSIAGNQSPSFSTYTLAGRVVSGTTRLYMVNNVGDVNEYLDPGSYGTATDFSDFPRASLNRAWPTVFNDRLILSDPPVPADSPVVRGIFWSPGGNLWAAYGPVYAGDRPSVPSLCAATLAEDGTAHSYGPWRTSIGQGHTRGYFVTTPEGLIAVGAPTTSGDSAAPWGLSLNTFPEPTITTLPPSDPNDPLDVAITVDQIANYNISTKQRRYDTDYLATSWNTPYDPAGGCTATAGTDEFTLMDMMGAAVWVFGGAKTGVITFGQMVKTFAGFPYLGGLNTQVHVWYGPPPTDCYGQQSNIYQVATGPGTASMQSVLWIYDTAAFMTSPVPVPQHTVAPYIPDLAGSNPPGSGAGSLYLFGGAYYEPISKRLYVTYGSADAAGMCCGLFNPVVFVFAVNDL